MGYFLMIAGFVGVPACLVILIVKAIRKKKLKTISLIMAGLFVCFVAGIILAPQMTPEQREAERLAADAEESAATKTMEPTIKPVSTAAQTTRPTIAPANTPAPTPIPSPTIDIAQVEAEKAEQERLAVTFDEIYKAYKENELRADDKYQYNRYRITAKINGMATGGLLNLFGGATLTMEKRVGDTIVFFYAEFEAEQEEALKEVNVGDTITFDGECLSAGSWVECEIVK